jgi:iron complex transport system substrate-binding protein
VILSAVGALDRVVACTRYCADVIPEVAVGSRIILADSWTADTQEIISARPELVIAAVPYQEKAVVEILRAGARFLGLAPKCLADIYTDIATIAGVVGASAQGEEVIGAMQDQIEQVRIRTQGLARPRVFCEEWGKPILTSQLWVSELVEAAGGDFIAAPGSQVSAEEIAALDPEVIIAAWCGAGDRVPLEKIIETRGWHKTTAARTGRVYCINDEFLNTPAPNLLQGLSAIAFAIHPELFSKPKGIRQITGVASSATAKSAL